jgi:ribulose-phosphate 3-epimerase
MNRPPEGWFDRLPTDRPIAEFSVWSANLLKIGEDLQRIQPHADLLHLDVADGHFAPAFLLFPDLLAQVRAASAVPLHVHLMVQNSILAAQVAQFADAGADVITVHAECAGALDAVQQIRQRGLLAGVVLQVETPVSALVPFLQDVQFVTLLGTAIGVKGKGLHEEALTRLTATKALIAQAGAAHRTVLVADGGIRHETVPKLRAAGADAVVLGSLAFGDADLGARMAWLAAQ